MYWIGIGSIIFCQLENTVIGLLVYVVNFSYFVCFKAEHKRRFLYWQRLYDTF
jgi:hypothetical protein